MGVTLIDLLIDDESRQEKKVEEEPPRPRVHAPTPAPRPTEKKETPPDSDRGVFIIDIMGDE